VRPPGIIDGRQRHRLGLIGFVLRSFAKPGGEHPHRIVLRRYPAVVQLAADVAHDETRIAVWIPAAKHRLAGRGGAFLFLYYRRALPGTARATAVTESFYEKDVGPETACATRMTYWAFRKTRAKPRSKRHFALSPRSTIPTNIAATARRRG